MPETKTILVAGATGKQGGAVARSLVKRGHRVKALTRDPSKAEPLKKMGAEVVRGDLTDRRGLEGVLRGVDGFYIVTTPFKPGFILDVEGEVSQGTTALDAAKAAVVPFVVLSSVASAGRNSGLPHVGTKARIEGHLRELGLAGTILRPVYFMENFLSPWMVPAIQAGTLAIPLRPQTKLQMVAVKDIGEIAARAFERPKEEAGQAEELAGDARTMPEVASLLSTKVGGPVKFVHVPDDEARRTMGNEMATMYRSLDTQGITVDIPTLEKRWGYRMTRFSEFLRETPVGGPR